MTASNGAGFGPLETPPHHRANIPDLDEVRIAWRDNAVFVWWDPDQEVYGQIHVSTTPNGEGSRARCALFARGRIHEFEEPLTEGSFVSDSIAVDLAGSVRVEHERVRLQLELTPLFTPVDWASIGALPAARPGMVLNHYQHGFRARGLVAIDGDRRKFAGTGWRDRTWGYREESAQWEEYFYLCSVFEQRYAVVLWKVLAVDGRERTFGAKITPDEQVGVTSFAITRDAAANLAAASVRLPAGELVLQTRPKPSSFAGWWLPMGRGRQQGPTLCEFDDYCLLEAGDGVLGAGVAAHGIRRKIA